MSHPKRIQSGEPARMQIHAVERLHTDGAFERLTSVDLTGASSLSIIVTDPSGVSSSIATVSIDDALGGLFGGDAVPTQLVEAGDWRIQGSFVLNGAARGTRIGAFEVEGNLPAPP